MGITWVMAKENYGRTTDGVDIFSNVDALYILAQSNHEIYKSIDSGVTWSIVNETFTNSGLFVGAVDSTENLYIATGPGEVWKSTDSGVTWSFLSDFNAGTNDPKGIAINSSDSIYIVDGLGDVYSSINGGASWTKINDGYGGSTGTDGLEVDSNNNLYILINSDVYSSTDSGVTWSIVNDDFSPYSNDGFEISIDSNDNLYILDGAGRVWKSTDLGVSWQEIGDFGGATPKGLTSFTQPTNLNLSVRTCNDAICSGESWIDITDISPQDLNLDNNAYFQYQISFTSPGVSITPEFYNISVDYDLINTAPSISLIVPQQGATYGDNESLDLNFSVFDSDANLDSCWYNLDDGSNVSLVGCANTTFNVAGDGDYVLNIYANDSLGEESSDNANFSIQVGAPSIVLDFPINEYLNYQENINFNYTPTDLDLDSCELWGDFDSSFGLNQTDNSPSSGIINTFYLDLNDGTYLWNIKCNDSVGNSAINGNQTFYIDTVNPSVSVSQPIGEKTSRTISSSWSVSDNNLNSCWYNVYQGASLEIANTSVTCLDNSASFDVSSDADFIFNFYVNDSAGNQNSTNSSFSVDTSSTTPPSTGGDSGSSGGGGGGGSYSSNGSGKMQVTQLGEIIAYEGDEKSLSLNVKNIGSRFLNNCRLIAKGDISSWVYSDKVKGIALGENVDFNFNLNVPEETGSGDYSGELEIKCDEGTDVQTLVVIIPGLEIIEVGDIIQEKEKLTVNYILKDNSLIGKEVNIEIWLVDRDDVEVRRITDNFLVEESGERQVIIQLPSGLAGVYSIYFALSSDLESFVRKSVVLGKSRTVGMVVLESVKSKMTVYVLFLLVLGVGVFFIWRRHKEDSPHVGKTKNGWLLKKKGFFKN